MKHHLPIIYTLLFILFLNMVLMKIDSYKTFQIVTTSVKNISTILEILKIAYPNGD